MPDRWAILFEGNVAEFDKPLRLFAEGPIRIRGRPEPGEPYQPVDKMPPPHERHSMERRIGALRPNILRR